MTTQPPAKKWMVRGLVALVLVGLIGHVYYWYWPRYRPSEPNSTSEVAGLVVGETGLDIRVWIPYPHQNLGALERRFDGLGSVLVAMEELVGLAPLELPSFGPFQLPPAKEMAFATDSGGTRFQAAARVYPAVALMFRAAGWLADNPWMAGGELTLGGRRIRIQWQGSVWMAATADLELPPNGVDLKIAECSALLRISHRLGPVPSGLFRFDTSRNRLFLTSDLEAKPRVAPGENWLQATEAALSWARITTSNKARTIQSWVVLSAAEIGTGGLPPVIVLQTGGQEPPELPGERILKAIGAQVFRGSLGDWELGAYDQDSLASAGALVAPLEALSKAVRTENEVSVGFVDLDEARQAVLEVGRALEQVPIIGEAEARTWLALARLLEDLTGYSFASIWLADSQQVDLEIW